MTDRLHIDWTRCRGRGACIELLEGLLRPDDWGYPVATDPTDERSDIAVADAAREAALDAVDRCPRLALTLTPAQPTRSVQSGIAG